MSPPLLYFLLILTTLTIQTSSFHQITSTTLRNQGRPRQRDYNSNNNYYPINARRSSSQPPFTRRTMRFGQTSENDFTSDNAGNTKHNTTPTYEESSLSSSSSSSTVIPTKTPNVGSPQRSPSKTYSLDSILLELAQISNSSPSTISILGTRHCSYLHQTIIELLAYAFVLSGNHVYTSGAEGTNAAAVRGALRADNKDLLTVILPQSMSKQSDESKELLGKVEDVITFPEHDGLTLDAASRLCNSELLSRTEQLVSFAFHDSGTVLECVREAEEVGKVVTVLYLD